MLRPRISLSLRSKLIYLLSQVDDIKSKVQHKNETAPYWKHEIIRERMPSESYSFFIASILFSEDRRFFDHLGFELRMFPRGIRRYFNYGRLGGMSTIDQQLVRIITGNRKRSLSRKLKEITLSVLLNFHCSKQEVLIAYLCSSYFGYRLEGVDKASEFIFGRPPFILGIREAALIASLLPYPMPRKIYMEINNRAKKFSTAHEFLDFSSPIESGWSKQINRKTNYILNGLGYSRAL